MTSVPKSRWFQFRLQTLFAIMTIVALASLVVRQHLEERQQRAELATLRAKNAALEAQMMAVYSELNSVARIQTENRPGEFQLPHHSQKIDQEP